MDIKTPTVAQAVTVSLQELVDGESGREWEVAKLEAHSDFDRNGVLRHSDRGFRTGVPGHYRGERLAPDIH